MNADPLQFGGGSNWYAYAGGDPIDNMDPFGLYAGLDDAAASLGGGLIGTAGQLFGDVFKFATDGGNWKGTWKGYGNAFSAGAAGGEASLYITPIGGIAVASALKNALDQGDEIAAGKRTNFSYTSLALNTGAGVLTGHLSEGISLPEIEGFNIGQGSYQAVSSRLFTQLKNGSIRNVSASSFGKMIVSPAFNQIPDALIDGTFNGLQGDSNDALRGDSTNQSQALPNK